MAGEGKPLAAKLGIVAGCSVAVVGAPRRWSIPGLPVGVSVKRGLGAGADVVLLFVRAAAELGDVGDLEERLRDTDALWVLWPRRAAGHESDVTDEVVRAAVLPTGLVDVKVAAVGEDWSGLRFVRRKELRAGKLAVTEIEALMGDITVLEVDAVVNAANRALAGGGGVDGAIHRAAGRAELARACAALGGCDPGDAKVTPGFGLPSRWIIHTVGPVWRGGGSGEPETLASCYRRSMEMAESLGASSVAFPAISTGVYGFPAGLAAEVALCTLRAVESAVGRVFLVAFDRTTLDIYRSLLD